ncbi:MAG: DUF1353 domain-containing protein [Candidatus Hodarchaeales archaeon]
MTDYPSKRRLDIDKRSLYKRKGLKADELFVLEKDFTVETEEGIFLFKEGFVWDQASVPRFLRGLLDNDDPRVVLGAMVHDACFSQKWLGYKGANKLFKSILVEKGMSKFKANLYYVGVASRKGKRIYNSIIKEKSWHTGHVHFTPKH